MVKNPPANAGDVEMWVRSLDWEDPLGEETTTYSSVLCLENPVDRGAWWATVHRVAKSQTRLKQINMHAYMQYS